PSDVGHPLIEPMDLPEIVSGLRIRQMTPFGNMHVKITVDPRSDRELEVFAQLGKGGDVANSDLEAICRIVSLWLRSGGGLRHIFKQLEGIGSSLQIPTRSGTIMSLGDGLACALKKYTRAKERFGLRALLLGEIDLAELDNPNPAPHTRASIPLDRPVQRTVPPAAPRASGAPRQLEVRGGRGAALPPKRSDVIDRPVLAQNADELHSGERRSSRTAPPPQMRAPASTVPARSELHATFAETSSVRAEPEGLPDDHLVSVALAEETTISEPLPETKTVTATATEVGGLVDWSRMMSPARHHHDAATHYKLACPECSAALVVQEGCRKCLHCGWAAC
ncbi:MAG: hypothetical protein KKB50_21140, partial [Planctomycetes bacterium]|nr:hypothetical protein [Planctomycetota bacterium]